MHYELFDLHCDTPLRMYENNAPLRTNNLQVSLEKSAPFRKYAQLAAIWSDKKLDDEAAYLQFWKVLGHFKAEIEANRHNAAICKSFDEFEQLPDSYRKFFLAVEDARIISGNVERLYELYDAGVRFLSLNWKGVNALGGGYDTSAPLSNLGRAVVDLALDLGMILDLSHSSAKVMDEVIQMAVGAHRPVIASHSDSFSVAAHPRNLTDGQFMRIRASGGIVGISLYPEHLCGIHRAQVGIQNIIEHIEYYLGLDGQYSVCLGCDFDGIDATPNGIEDLSTLYRLADAMSARNFSDELIRLIFYQNAYNFLKKI